VVDVHLLADRGFAISNVLMVVLGMFLARRVRPGAAAAGP
jgi:hypothetical protein